MLQGILAIRHMHMRVLRETGMSTADEMLYPDNLQYLSDIMSYIAVGARSVENQYHRLVASGCDVPVGMKNPTSGDMTVMLNSVVAAQLPHDFIFRGDEVSCPGNPLTHVILRGAVNKRGQCSPNYHYEDLRLLYDLYSQRELKIRPASWTPIIPTPTNSTKSRCALQKRYFTAAATPTISAIW